MIFQADWASCIDGHHSTTSYCIYLGGKLITWSSRKQKIVGHSSTEEEYHTLA